MSGRMRSGTNGPPSGRARSGMNGIALKGGAGGQRQSGGTGRMEDGQSSKDGDTHRMGTSLAREAQAKKTRYMCSSRQDALSLANALVVAIAAFARRSSAAKFDIEVDGPTCQDVVRDDGWGSFLRGAMAGAFITGMTMLYMLIKFGFFRAGRSKTKVKTDFAVQAQLSHADLTLAQKRITPSLGMECRRPAAQHIEHRSMAVQGPTHYTRKAAHPRFVPLGEYGWGATTQPFQYTG